MCTVAPLVTLKPRRSLSSGLSMLRVIKCQPIGVLSHVVPVVNGWR